MDNIILQKTWVQGCPVIVDNLLGTAFTGEAQAHTFVVSGVDAAQEPVTITGTITGKFLAANNVTVPLTGSLVNGAASVTLTDECYDVPGRYILSIYATNGSTTQCLYCAVGNVFRTDSQTIAYPSTDLPNITTLMAQLEEILDGWPADYSQLQNDVSDLKSQFVKNGVIEAGNNHYEQYLTEIGAILYNDGTERNSSSFSTHRRTPYILLPKDAVIDITGMVNITANAMLAVYTINKEYSKANSIAGSGGSYLINTTFVMPFDGYVRFATTDVYAATAVIINATGKQTINMLVLGNSFSQDSFAYVPKIFEELNTNYRMNLVIGYKSGSLLSDHTTAITNNTAYDFVDVWSVAAHKWDRYASGGANEKTASQLLAMHTWDLIYIQPTGSIATDDSVITNAVTPAKALLRQLNSSLGYGFTLLAGQWLCSQDAMSRMKTAIELINSQVGISHIMPVGTGIANARSNATFAALGDNGDMLYDSTHQQSGIPALISAYVIVESLLGILGDARKSIYLSTFSPTDANCIAIGAYKTEGMETPMPMTHGSSVGVTDANVLAAKQIASIAVNNPYVISDCSSILS